MTGREIDFKTNDTVPVIYLNPFANLGIFVFPIIYIMLNGARGLVFKEKPTLPA